MRTIRRALFGLLCLGTLFIAMHPADAQVSFRQPGPGDIYREYGRVVGDWRVTDPDATYFNGDSSSGNNPYNFLPNATIDLNVGDLQGATRAEATFSIWGGHLGTTGRRISFNGNSWLDIPHLGAVNGIPSGEYGGECYCSQYNVTIDVPLGHLKEGSNTFQGTSGGQTCYTFGWGQWGWYSIMLRVYYGSSKPHPTGSITSPAPNTSLPENPNVTVSTSANVDRVEFVAYYDGFDTDGDGVYQEYHGDYHPDPGDSELELKRHVGTATGSDRSVTWNTEWVPDQNGIKLLARVRDGNGVWYATNEVTGLSVNRGTKAVRFYKPKYVPDGFVVRSHNLYRSSTFDVTDLYEPSRAANVGLHIRTWNGINGQGDPPGHHTRIANWYAPLYGQNHYYSGDILDVTKTEIVSGENTLEIHCVSDHHGIEVMWPGPAVMVRYNDFVLPVQLSAFWVSSVDAGGVALRWRTLSEINNYGFEVERGSAARGPFQTIPRSFVPGHGTSALPHEYAFTDSARPAGDVYYRLRQIDLDNTVHYSEAIKGSLMTGVGQDRVPTTFALDQNYPNPFNPSTKVSFAVPSESFVTIKIYNQLGQVVKTLVEGQVQAGRHELSVNATDLSSGIYFCRMQSGSFVATRKLTVLK